MPELFLRVRGRRSPSVDVHVVVEATHTVAELTTGLAGHLGEQVDDHCVLGSVRLGRALDPASLLERVDLVTGDELILGGEAGGFGDVGVPAADGLAAIDVIAGPDAGRSFVVRPSGRYPVGRAPDATVRIDDPSVSRHHATIQLGGDGASVVPRPGAANGVLVNGLEIVTPTPVAATDVITLGATRLAIRPVPARIDRGRDTFGRIDFHRTPYRPVVVAAPELEPLGPVPERAEPRRIPAVAAVAPLLAGLAMYAFTRQLQFLALTLLAPFVLVGSTIEDRRSGRRSYRDRVERFRLDLVEHRRRLEAHREAERIDRFRAAPDLADLVRRAELRTIDLWARGRTAPDFLSLRLGLGAARTRCAVELEPGGDDELRREALAALDGLDVLDDVPVTVELDSVLAVHGEPTLVNGVAASLLVQAAALHSPEDLTIAVAAVRDLEWVRWLPHARSVTSPLPGDHLARTPDAAAALVDRLVEVAELRVTGRSHGSVGSTEPAWPRVLAALDATLRVDPAQVARLLDLAPAAGIAVVWLADTAAEVPRQATRLLAVRRAASGAMRGLLWSTDPSAADSELEVEHLRPVLADRAARALAPIRDASTVSLATMVPRTAPLLDVLGVGRPTGAWVAEQWHHRDPDALRFPVGIGPDGPVELDLVGDGPHALIGGTSGSGKSELLQSMVAALAVHHPPTRLNFLFVDYKGGAASQVFERLPHTVGYVTNLSADLAERALVSLRAELHRRMALLEGRAKDLAELVRVAPDDAPPSLVIVVDEFATLVREVPDFVAGIVDVAQRGRSLGIHLVLATQRPTGAVNENILANTNLRISLRMLDRAESTAIVGVPDAADIPVPLRGRGVVRLGPRQLVEFQSAFGGAPLLAADVRPPVLVGSFASPSRPLAAASAHEVAEEVTHLDAVLDAVVAAHRRLGSPVPRRPWCDVLPDVVRLDDVLQDPAASPAHESPGRYVAIGLLDAPERQEQHAALVDLEDGGGLLVFGSAGTGATTLVRTVAASIARTAEGGVAVLAIDAVGRGLAALARLPGAVDVVTGDDVEAITRHLVVLEAEIDRRRRVLGTAEHLSAFAALQRDAPPRLVMLIDGFGALVDALLDAAPHGDEWVERLVRIVLDGRQVGVHGVLTAERRSAVPARLHAAIANRLVLRHADDSGYADHGLAASRGRGLVPGRGWWQGSGQAASALVQVASVSADPSGRAQCDEIDRWSDHVRATGVEASHVASLRSTALPERVGPASAPGGLAVSLGAADVTGEAVVVDLDWSHLTVCGPARSGRSTALATVAAQLAAGWAGPGRTVVVAGPASSPLRALAGLPGVRTAFGAALAEGVERRPDDGVRVVVIDDLDRLDAVELGPVFDRLARDDDARLVASIEPRTGFTTNPLLTIARQARRMLMLRPDDPADFLQLTGIRLAVRPGLRMPPGRGVLVVDRVPTVVQVADPGSVGVGPVGVAG